MSFLSVHFFSRQLALKGFDTHRKKYPFPHHISNRSQITTAAAAAAAPRCTDKNTGSTSHTWKFLQSKQQGLHILAQYNRHQQQLSSANFQTSKQWPPRSVKWPTYRIFSIQSSQPRRSVRLWRTLAM